MVTILLTLNGAPGRFQPIYASTGLPASVAFSWARPSIASKGYSKELSDERSAFLSLKTEAAAGSAKFLTFRLLYHARGAADCGENRKKLTLHLLSARKRDR